MPPFRDSVAVMQSIPSPAELDVLADRGWPAVQREPLGPWTLRFASGVTNRANSVLPTGRVDADSLPATIAAAERAYRDRGLPTVFQVSPATDPALVSALAARGYREHSDTLVLVADRAAVASAGIATPDAPARIATPDTPARIATPAPSVAPTSTRAAPTSIAPTPSRAWMDLWWSVDGRGGADAEAVAERILTGGPALYASAGEPEHPDAVARLAIVGDWGGVFAVATRPDQRRRGHAAAVISAVAADAERLGILHLWLQVTAANSPARALYDRLGFVEASRYAYWTEPAPQPAR